MAAKLQFDLISKLETKHDQILSAMLIFDRFENLGSHNNNSFDIEKQNSEEFLSSCYILLTTDDGSILLYKTTKKFTYGEENWELHRQIKNPVNEQCWKFDYFNDEKLKKTFFYFAFSANHIFNYNIKDNTWKNTELATMDNVTSMNFVRSGKNNLGDDDSNSNKFLIYTQWYCHSVIIGDVGTGKIARKADLENVNHILDCCVWNDGSSECNGNDSTVLVKYLILSCYGSNKSIIIMDFDTLEVLFVKTMNYCPLNSIKILRKTLNENGKVKYREGLVSFLGARNESKIVFYENKI